MDLETIKAIVHIEDDKPTRDTVAKWVNRNASHAELIAVSSKRELDELIQNQPSQDIQLILIDSQITGEVNVIDTYVPVLRSAARGKAFHRAAIILCSGEPNRPFRFGNPPWVQDRIGANRIRRELGPCIEGVPLPSEEEIRQMQRRLNPAQLAEAFQALMIHKVLAPLQAFGWCLEAGKQPAVPQFLQDVQVFRSTHLQPLDRSSGHPLLADIDAAMSECLEQACALSLACSESARSGLNVIRFYEDLSALRDRFLLIIEKLENRR
jgi:hypothetical protein